MLPHRMWSLLAAGLLLGAPQDSRGQAAGNPLYFSVLAEGRGRAVGSPNDVRAMTNDGAKVFLASPPSTRPRTTNVQVLRAQDVGLNGPDEIDGLSWGKDAIAAQDSTGSFPDREILFSADRTALGRAPGSWPESVYEMATDRASPSVYFKVWGASDNHIGVRGRLIGLARGDSVNLPDDLDALDFRTGVGPGPSLPGPRLYFSVKRGSLGVPGSAVAAEVPAQAADIFLSDYAGNNFLFAQEGAMGLALGDELDALALLDRSYDPDDPGNYGPANGQMDPGVDLVYFSVDWSSTGMPGTAVAAAAGGGSVAGYVFFSDFTGTNHIVHKPVELALLDGTVPGQGDEDNLNALDVLLHADADGDSIPDVVDNCRFIPNGDQIDTDNNGVGDVCEGSLGVSPAPEGSGPDLALAASPNPFVAATRLSFSVPTAGTVRVEVFNVAGQRVATLVNRALPAGRWEATWNGRSDEGASVSPGFYFARVTQGAESAAHKIVRMQ